MARWEPGWQQHEAIEAQQEALLEHLQGLVDNGGVAADLGAEERLSGDGQRQAHHLDEDVARLPRPPFVQDLLGGVDHDRGVGRDALAGEGRLDQAALPQPEIALAGQQALAQDQRRHPQGKVLDVILVIVKENGLNVLGIADKVDAPRPEAQRDNIAIIAGTARKEFEPALLVFTQVAGQQRASGTRRPLRYRRHECASCWRNLVDSTQVRL